MCVYILKYPLEIFAFFEVISGQQQFPLYMSWGVFEGNFEDTNRHGVS